MRLVSLTLSQFRNHSKRAFSFSPKTTVIVGANAIGKTNILEAIHVLSTGTSFRADVDREMIFYEKEIARVTGRVQDERGEESVLEVMLTTGTVGGEHAPLKKYLVNGVSKRMMDYVGSVRCVIFWPQDLELITHSPSRRRRYLDSVLSQVDREYRRTLVSYEKGLRSRNKLLDRIREGLAKRQELLFWDQLLIRHGEYISRKREEFINFINSQNWKIDEKIMHVVYDHSHISEARLAKYAQEEVLAATTLVGPHRDDFLIEVQMSKLKSQNVEGRNLHSYGSRGEQRLAVLWLKVSQLTFIQSQTGQRPALLLDDIFSELDHEHRALVMEVVPKQQTIITTTDEHLIAGSRDFHLVRLAI